MSAVHIDINRVMLSLHGVSSLVVEEAISGLENEMRRRLGVFPRDSISSLNLQELAIGPLQSKMLLDATALRGLIADRLVEAVMGTHDSSVTKNEEIT